MGVAHLFVNETAGLTVDQAAGLYLDFVDEDSLSGQSIGLEIGIQL